MGFKSSTYRNPHIFILNLKLASKIPAHIQHPPPLTCPTCSSSLPTAFVPLNKSTSPTKQGMLCITHLCSSTIPLSTHSKRYPTGSICSTNDFFKLLGDTISRPPRPPPGSVTCCRTHRTQHMDISETIQREISQENRHMGFKSRGNQMQASKKHTRCTSFLHQ